MSETDSASGELAVLYRWRVDPDHEASFTEAWREVTRHLRLHHGSLGSRLHRGDDGWHHAYARWPSEAARAAAFDADHPELEDAQEAMRAAVVESRPPALLRVVAEG
ncbi:MAG: antibiotic biosynthesis monooxygenase [Phycisphaerales bacterium]|jgi:heme-degrading monooxygenase HmoA